MNTFKTDHNIESIIKSINKHKSRLIKILVSVLLLSILYLFTSEKYYESNITLYPAGELSDDTTLMSSIIAQTAGLGELYSPSYYIPDIIASRTLKESIILNKWHIDSDTLNLIEFWKLDSDGGYLDSFFSSNKNKDDVYLNSAVDILDNLIIIDESSTGLISVFVYNQNSKLAAEIANYISKYVVEFVTEQQRKFASQNKVFVENQLQNALSDLNISEQKLTTFRKKHPITLDSPDLQLQRARLLRDVEVNQEVYITLRQQFEITKIEESKVRLLVNILDTAKPSIKVAHPKSILIIFFGFFIAITLCVFYLFAIDIVNRTE